MRVVFISTLAFFILSSIGFMALYKYGYIDILNHYHSSFCYINKCNVYYDDCCSNKTTEDRNYYNKDKDKDCLNCSYAILRFSLILSEEYITTTSISNVSNDFCNIDLIVCYYNDINIQTSLSLKDTKPSLISFPSIFALGSVTFGALMILIIILIIHVVQKNRRTSELSQIIDPLEETKIFAPKRENIIQS